MFFISLLTSALTEVVATRFELFPTTQVNLPACSSHYPLIAKHQAGKL